MRPAFATRFKAFGTALLAGAVLLAGCAPAAPQTMQPTAEAAGLPTGPGVISGTIPEAAQLWPGEALLVYAVPFYADQGDPEEGFYVLDTGRHPPAELTAEGSFALTDLQPGSYVLVAGPRAEDSRLAMLPDQTTLILELGIGQSLTLENLELAR